MRFIQQNVNEYLFDCVYLSASALLLRCVVRLKSILVQPTTVPAVHTAWSKYLQGATNKQP